jgi:acetoin utilization protein AcuC
MTERVHPVALVRDASAEDYDFGRDHPLAPVRVTQLGCATLAPDPLARLALTLDDMAEITARPHTLAHEAAEGRWIATGGGGYELVSLVPRTCTLAFAETTGASLLIETPMTWRELVIARTGQAPPHDFSDAVPPLGEDGEAHTRRMAAESIATMRELVFPRHGVR